MMDDHMKDDMMKSDMKKDGMKKDGMMGMDCEKFMKCYDQINFSECQ
jgi:hypothetical protein